MLYWEDFDLALIVKQSRQGKAPPSFLQVTTNNQKVGLVHDQFISAVSMHLWHLSLIEPSAYGICLGFTVTLTSMIIEFMGRTVPITKVPNIGLTAKPASWFKL